MIWKGIVAMTRKASRYLGGWRRHGGAQPLSVRESSRGVPSNTLSRENVMTNSPMMQVVLEGPRAISNLLLGGPGGQAVFQDERTVESLTRGIALRASIVSSWSIGLAPVGLPLRAMFGRNGKTVYLVEYPPGTRNVPWITRGSRSDFGAGTQYEHVTIAFPYVVFFITITSAGTLSTSSVYFRTTPLTKADYSDELCDCHFLNCSVNAYGVYCWICSQKMQTSMEPGQSVLEYVAALLNYFWFSAFNRSSERHEGQSFFGKGSAGKRPIPDARIRTIEAWIAASREDPAFVLEVPWNPSGRTVQHVFEELTGPEQVWPFVDAGSVANLIQKPPGD